MFVFENILVASIASNPPVLGFGGTLACISLRVQVSNCKINVCLHPSKSSVSATSMVTKFVLGSI